MPGDKRPQLIWDLPLRLWHWALVICFAGSWIVAEAGFEWTQTHFYLYRAGARAVSTDLGRLWHPAFALCLVRRVSHARVSLPQKRWLLQPDLRRS